MGGRGREGGLRVRVCCVDGAGPEQRRRVSGLWVGERVTEVRRGEGEVGGGERRRRRRVG